MQNSLLHVFTDPLAIVAESGAVIESNIEARTLLSPGSASDLASLRDVVEDEHALAAFLEQSLHADRFMPGTLPIRMPDGGVREIPVEGSRLGNGQEGVVIRFESGAARERSGALNIRVNELEQEAERRVSAEARLTSSELRFRTLFNAASDSVLVFEIEDDDRAGPFVEANDIGLEMLGYSRDEMLGMSIYDIVAADVNIPEKLSALYESGRVLLETRYVTKDGRVIPVEVSSHMVELDGRRTVLSVARDISARKRIERERTRLYHRERRARRIAEAAHERTALLAEVSRMLSTSLNCREVIQDLADMLVPRVADGCAVVLVEGACETAGSCAVAHLDPAKRPLMADLVDRYDVLAEAGLGRLSILETGEAIIYPSIDPNQVDAFISDADVQSIVLQLDLSSVMIVPMKVHERTIGAIALVYSGSKQYFEKRQLPVMKEVAALAANEIEVARLFTEAQHARSEAEKMNRLKTAFLANMSHEIRTPLTSIIGFSALLQEQLPPEQQPLAEYIWTGGRRLLETLDSVLSLAQLESGVSKLELKTVDVVPVATDIVNIFAPRAEAHGLKLRLELDTDDGNAIADAGAVTSVLQNLIGNAIKFTPDGEVVLRVSRSSEHVVLEVQDTGIGIDADFLPRLFEPFYQESEGWNRSYEGTGLGLTIARRLIDQMNGSLVVESRKHEGTRFTVTLESAEPSEAESSSDDDPHRYEERRLLLVEDNVETGAFMEALLGDLVMVTLATDAEEALARIDESPHVFDMIVLDIHLGHGKSGTDLLSEIRKNPEYATVPVAAVTAYAMPGDRDKLLESGFNAYLSKPFAMEDLLGMVTSLIDNHT